MSAMQRRRRPRRPRQAALANFYAGALDAAAQEDLERAAAVEGLDDEVALLRLLVRRELAAHPESVRLVLQGMALLVRAVTARYRLTPADEQALLERVAAVVGAFTEAVEEAADA